VAVDQVDVELLVQLQLLLLAVAVEAQVAE
jgi:hypothetical protein